VKGGLIVTATGLLFATAADQKVHVYDSADGTELTTLPLGGPTSGQPSMYEWGGRQYLLVTTSIDPATTAGSTGSSVSSAVPTGLVAYALPARAGASK
jgi:quinoprotein glucose dehydrogenase